MKIGVSSYSLRKHAAATKCSYVDLCNIAKEMGFEGIEFINLDNKDYTMGTDDIFACAEKIRKHCEAIGLEILAYTVDGNILAEDFDAEFERLKKCVDVAEALGAPVMRHDVCYSLPGKLTWEDAIEVMVPRIREITEYAKAKGIKTCTENHGYIFQAPERVEKLIRAVNNENYGWLCDMGNFLCADADPLKAVTIAAPYAFHVHAKDFLYKSAEFDRPSGYFGTASGNYLRGTVVGHGVVPIKSCVKALKRGGYDGWMSIEFEGMEENLPALRAGLEFLKKVVE